MNEEEKMRIKHRKPVIGAVCAAGWATSSLIVIGVKRELEKRGIDAEVINTKIFDLEVSQDKVDIIVSASKLNNSNYTKPIVDGMPFVTGVGVNEAIDKIVFLIKKKFNFKERGDN